MQRIGLAQTIQLCANTAVYIHSHQLGLYTVEIYREGERTLLVDHHGETYRFRSIVHVRETLNWALVDHVYLVHHCAYDEMIGHPDLESKGPSVIPLNWTAANGS